MNTNEYIQNRNAMTLEELAPYEDRFVAVSEDGKRILAHAAEEAQLYEEIARLRVVHYVVDYIPPFDKSLLGGGAPW